MNNSISSRYLALDLLKLIAAYMVVFIHVPFFAYVGNIVRALARFAVPVFFVSSGFFCYGKGINVIVKRKNKIFRIFLFASILYNLMNILFAVVVNGLQGGVEYLSIFGSIQKWIELFVFNTPFSATRLWFLLALIYVYNIQKYIVEKQIKERTIFLISVLGILINLVFNYYLTVNGITDSEQYTRNFLLTGYPFFGIGLFIKKYEIKLCNINKGYYIVGIMLGVILTLISMVYVGEHELYLGSVIMVVCAFIISIKCSIKVCPSIIVKLLECSLGIYILHRPVTIVLEFTLKVLSLFESDIVYEMIFPILVCLLTTMITFIIVEIKSNTSICKYI